MQSPIRKPVYWKRVKCTRLQQ